MGHSPFPPPTLPCGPGGAGARSPEDRGSTGSQKHLSEPYFVHCVPSGTALNQPAPVCVSARVCVCVQARVCVCVCMQYTPWTEPPDCTLGYECEYLPINYLTILWTWHLTLPGSLTQLLSLDCCSFFPIQHPFAQKEVCFQGFVTILHVRLDRRSIETKVNVTWKLMLYIDYVLLLQIWMICRFHHLYAFPKQNIVSWIPCHIHAGSWFRLLLIYTNSFENSGHTDHLYA